MIPVEYDVLHQLIKNGRVALNYAWENYDKLAAVEASYTLYGPPSPYLGVMAAGHLTPEKDRKLYKKPRWKRYNIYELDANFNVIRVKHIRKDGKTDCIYHLFELDNVIYGCPFSGEKKQFYSSRICAIKYDENRPLYYAVTGPTYLWADFYEYSKPNEVITTCYIYSPERKFTSEGLPVSWDVPIGDPNSPASVDICVENYHQIDFRKLLDKGSVPLT